MMNRKEHLAWCKERAVEYADRGEIVNAVASMGSDLSKHPDTKDHPGVKLGLMLAMSGNMATPADCRRWIEGFN